MKALILAAGHGTRLLPHTGQRPKPLFTLAGKPLLGITIDTLIRVGCQAIVINCHHLHEQIQDFVGHSRFPIPVVTRFEPEILDTGGAIRNVRDYMGDSPFFVVNADIVHDIDLAAVWETHMQGDWPATLAVVDDSRFNTVLVQENGSWVTGFHSGAAVDNTVTGEDRDRNLTFTGIQVLSPDIFKHMPVCRRFSSIDVYSALAGKGRNVKAHICQQAYWNDIGTPEAYTAESVFALADLLLPRAGRKGRDTASVVKLAGDGSDRSWYRVSRSGKSVIVADHGIQQDLPGSGTEMTAFVSIGNHLRAKQLPVPEILAQDRFSGLVALQDLGDEHLQSTVLNLGCRDAVVQLYSSLCDLTLQLSLTAAAGFDPAWTYQTPVYSESMILENECRYFIESFVQGYLGLSTRFDDLMPEFLWIAGQIEAFGYAGFMHRDFQSRNIMIHEGCPWIIDFQGGRIGPVQYDLASLLIDPYVNLDTDTIDRLVAYSAAKYQGLAGGDPQQFIEGYRLCAVTRNLQMLGAFSFLSSVRKKPHFQQYIPIAVARLKKNVMFLDPSRTSRLQSLVNVL